MPAQLILASSSPYRKQILTQAGFSFHSSSPSIDETRLHGESANELVKRLSLAKARALQDAYPRSLIIGSDQVVECGSEILGKPADYDDAVRQLELVSGNNVTLHTGLALLNTSTGHSQLAVDTYQVHYRNLTAMQIKSYLDAEKPFDCCGSLKVEGPGIRMIRTLTGTDPNTLMGLPLLRLIDMLENEGYDLNSNPSDIT